MRTAAGSRATAGATRRCAGTGRRTAGATGRRAAPMATATVSAAAPTATGRATAPATAGTTTMRTTATWRRATARSTRRRSAGTARSRATPGRGTARAAAIIGPAIVVAIPAAVGASIMVAIPTTARSTMVGVIVTAMIAVPAMVAIPAAAPVVAPAETVIEVEIDIERGPEPIHAGEGRTAPAPLVIAPVAADPVLRAAEARAVVEGTLVPLAAEIDRAIGHGIIPEAVRATVAVAITAAVVGKTEAPANRLGFGRRRSEQRGPRQRCGRNRRFQKFLHVVSCARDGDSSGSLPKSKRAAFARSSEDCPFPTSRLETS